MTIMRIILLGLVLPVFLAFMSLWIYWSDGGGRTRVDCNQDWDESAEEARCEQMYRRVLGHWSEHGEFPPSLRDLGMEPLPPDAAPWTYKSRANSFTLGLGNYDRCDWEITRTFSWWYEPHITPPPDFGSEGVLLLRLVVRHYLERGEWPARLEDMGLDPNWGDHGPWSVEKPGAPSEWDPIEPGALTPNWSDAPIAIEFYWEPEYYYNI